MSEEREMFALPLTAQYDDLPFEYVSRMLEAIATGQTCFGEFREWREWFHYLLPRALGEPFRIRLDYRIELVMTAFFAQYPSGLSPAPYREFPQDSLLTAGRAIMNPELWDGDHLRVGSGLLRESRRYGQVWWYLDEVNPALSASLFFCLKYLDPGQIAEWTRSVLEIRCSYWRAQLMVWLAAAKPMLEGRVTQPADIDKAIEWEWSHCLKGYYDGLLPAPESIVDVKGRAIKGARPEAIPFVAAHNLRPFCETCNTILSSAERKTWVAQVTAIPLLEKEMGHLANEFLTFELRVD